MKKKAGIFGSGSVISRYGSKDPDPYQNDTDPKHCFQLKMFNLNYPLDP